jgi:hypothetical protein
MQGRSGKDLLIVKPKQKEYVEKRKVFVGNGRRV